MKIDGWFEKSKLRDELKRINVMCMDRFFSPKYL